MLWLPLFFQFRLYHDPILSFSGMLPVFLSVLFSALIFLSRHLDGGHVRHLILSVIFFNLTLYFYELSVPLVFLFLIVLLHQRRPRDFPLLFKQARPYLISVVAALLAMVIARHFKDPVSIG